VRPLKRAPAIQRPRFARYVRAPVEDAGSCEAYARSNGLNAIGRVGGACRRRR
jgi:hypothetical protein